MYSLIADNDKEVNKAKGVNKKFKFKALICFLYYSKTSISF